jgi:nucleotide-binding universal stress UspA family protein
MHETASSTQTRQSIIKVKAHTNMYETILVGIDGSEFSKAALINATNWVRRHGGRLFLVHAVYFDEEEFSIAPGQREKRFKLGKEICYQTKEEVFPKLGKDVESFICEGEPHDVIVDVASIKNADLIAIGTHGRKGFKKLFMGSVTSRVIVSSPCDVLVVKKPLSEDPGKYKSILLSFDGSEFSKKALDRACELSKIEGAEITALYVIPQYEEMIEFFSTSLIKENLLHDAQKIVEEAKNLALDQDVSIKTEIAEGHAAEKIIDTANRLGSDLIIRGTYGWRGIDKAIIGSIIENVIVNVSCPVLVVK